ncbi:MAG: hypothetical protein J5I93_23410, partial [Pirellulaceae bacterium]|nr:hypothetical protein [Pirellulaceae bacterium]
NPRCLALSPDGRWLAAGSEREARIRVWDVAAGTLVYESAARNGGPVGSLAFDRPGRRLIAGLISDIRWWHLPDLDGAPRVVPRASGKRPGVGAFAPDGQVVACSFDNSTVHLVSSSDCRTLAELQTPGHSVISRLRFSPDGSRLAVATENHALHVWDLAAIRRQLDALSLDWEPAAEFAEPLGPAARYAVFQWDEQPRSEAGRAALSELRERFAASSDFEGRGYELAGTCFRRGLALEQQGQLEQALAEYHSACLLEPSAQHLAARGWLYLRLGRESAAAADWAGSLDPDSREFWDLYRRAILRLHVGDQPGYRGDCRYLLRRYGPLAEAGMAEQLAKLCLLVPSEDSDREQVLQLARRALDHDPEFRWYQAVRGLAETRCGDPESAIQLLQQVMQSERGQHPVIDALVQLALAINYRQLDRDQEAEAAFEQANQLIDQLRRYGNDQAATLAWHDWLVIQILHREALRN